MANSVEEKKALLEEQKRRFYQETEPEFFRLLAQFVPLDPTAADRELMARIGSKLQELDKQSADAATDLTEAHRNAATGDEAAVLLARALAAMERFDEELRAINQDLRETLEKRKSGG